MRKPNEDLDPFLNDVVTLLTAQARDKPHAARIVLIARIIQPLRRGETWNCSQLLHRFLTS